MANTKSIVVGVQVLLDKLEQNLGLNFVKLILYEMNVDSSSIRQFWLDQWNGDNTSLPTCSIRSLSLTEWNDKRPGWATQPILRIYTDLGKSKPA